MAHNTIYERLTANPDDLVGALAYIIYKKQKVEFYKSHIGGGPSQAEIDSFHAIASLQTSIGNLEKPLQLWHDVDAPILT